MQNRIFQVLKLPSVLVLIVMVKKLAHLKIRQHEVLTLAKIIIIFHSTLRDFEVELLCRSLILY